MKSYFFLILITILFNQCTYFSQEKVEERIKTNFNVAERTMVTNFTKDSLKFAIKYQRILKLSNDSATLGNLEYFYLSLTQALKFIETLDSNLSSINDAKSANEKVKSIFVESSIGDSLFNKIKLAYVWAENISLEDSTRNEIKKSLGGVVGEPLQEQQLYQYFGNNTPTGAKMILYGIEMELLSVGNEALDNYLQN